MKNNNNTLLDLISVSKEYPIYSSVVHKIIMYKQVLKDVNLKIFPSTTIGILGESGSGKTTIAKLITMIEKVSSGKILFEGVDITNFSLKTFATKVQMVFQNPSASLNPKLTIGYLLKERVKQYYNLINEKKEEKFFLEKMLEFLDIVKLPNKILNMYSSQLSGGQRQRVAILLSIVLHPKLLILDEPLSSLDISLQSQVLNFLSEIKTKFNLTYIFITHDISLAEYFCDKIFKLENGVINEIS
jgi:ABC-type dipeptide/oligopeptide/nickel transport system ATPase subunit